MTATAPLHRTMLLATLVLLGLAGPAAAAGGSGGGGSGSGGGGSNSTTDADMPGEVLVKLRSTQALAPLLSKYPVTLVSRFGSRPIYRLKAIGSARVKDILAALALEPEVMLAETNPTHRSPEARKNRAWVIGTPQAFAAQWAPQAMHLPEAQALSSGAGVRVAVIDTGVDRSHPLLAGRLAGGFDFVDFDHDPSEVGSPANAGYGHGSHVAGLVAMAAPGASIVPIRALDADGVGNAWVLAEALLHAVDPDGNPATLDGTHVINLSLGSLTRTRLMNSIAMLVACAAALPGDPIGDRSDPGYRDDDTRCSSGGGSVMVAAAGNDSSNSVKQYPAAESAYGLLAMGASDASGRLASFSNSGSWIDLAAPGDGITSAVPGGWGTWSGTSMAAPLAAGVAALLRAREPWLTATEVVRRIERNGALICDSRVRQVDAIATLLDTTAAPLTCF